MIAVIHFGMKTLKKFAAVGMLTVALQAQADEQLFPVLTTLDSTTVSGYLDFTASWKPGPVYSIEPQVIPEPSTITIFAIGGLFVGWALNNRRNKSGKAEQS